MWKGLRMCLKGELKRGRGEGGGKEREELHKTPRKVKVGGWSRKILQL